MSVEAMAYGSGHVSFIHCAHVGDRIDPKPSLTKTSFNDLNRENVQ